MNDIEAVQALKPLNRRLMAERDGAVNAGDLQTAERLEVELEAMHRAMALMGNRHSSVRESQMEVFLHLREIVELLALIRDEDGDADEAVLDELEQKLAAALRSIVRRQVTEGAAA